MQDHQYYYNTEALRAQNMSKGQKPYFLALRLLCKAQTGDKVFQISYLVAP